MIVNKYLRVIGYRRSFLYLIASMICLLVILLFHVLNLEHYADIEDSHRRPIDTTKDDDGSN
jgi:hypothetical protein